MYLYYLTPNINFIKPRKNLGTFFTTTCINSTSFHISMITKLIQLLLQQHLIKITNRVNGSKITNNIPNPNPIKHTANVFFSILNIITFPLYHIILKLEKNVNLKNIEFFL